MITIVYKLLNNRNCYLCAVRKTMLVIQFDKEF